MVFVDVGANKGEFTIFAAKYLPAGKVISFEPVQALSEELAANVAANHFKLVQIIPLGLGNIAQERILFNAATQYEGEWNQGVFSLYPRDHLRDAYEVVRTVRMDDLLKEGIILRIDMLKIDIEGAELEMLQGAAETIQRWMPVIFIEINALTCQAAGYQPGDILSFLEAFGYGFHAINRNGGTKPVTKDHLKIFQNLLCLPPSYKR
jgi:FkbM family methyltransferase